MWIRTQTPFMTLEIAIVFALLLLTFMAMVWEKWSVDLVALAAMGALMASGILSPEETFKVFSNEATIAIACMFILSAALDYTGAIEKLGAKLDRFTGSSEVSLLALTLPFVAVISAFMNNTPVVVVFLPLLISLAAKRDIRPSKLLMPLSFAAIFGGSCTLIGTSTNILVSISAKDHGQPPIGMFELTPAAAILGVIGLAYLLTVGRWLLPSRDTLSTILQTTESRQFLTEVVIASGSPLIGKTIAESGLKNLRHSRILEVIREGEILSTPLDKLKLKQGDRLRITTVLSSVMEMKDLEGIQILPKSELGLEQIGLQKAVVMESVVGPNSELIGKTIRQINFRQRYGILILALHRQGQNLRQNFENIRLNFGDTILMEGTESAIAKLREDRNFLLLTDATQGIQRRSRMGLALATIGLVALLAAVTPLSIALLAFLGAIVVVAGGCLTVEEAYRAINWKVIFLILGTLSLGFALEKTGGADFIAGMMIDSLGGMGGTVVLSMVFALSSILTLFLSNNAVAVLLTPIVITTAIELGVDARPFIIAVALGASASFATPVGYQTNALVYGAGGYRFSDFLKVGLPLNVLFWIASTFIIPWFWPLEMPE